MITQKTLIQIIGWLANTPTNRICPSTSLKEDLDLDSIDFLDLIVRLERSFNVNFTEDEIEGMETVQDLSKYLNSRRIVPIIVSTT